MKSLTTMTPQERADFMSLLANGLVYLAEEEGIEKPLFVLLVFNAPGFGQDANYVSNCDRSTMPAVLREAANKIEKGLEQWSNRQEDHPNPGTIH